MLKDAVNLEAIHRALVVKLRHHGDVLLTSPLFTVLKNHAPHVEIDALIYRDTEPMLSGHPAISEIYTIDRAWKHDGTFAKFSHERRLFRALRRRQYDLLIQLTDSPRGAWLSWLLGPSHAVTLDYSPRRGRIWHGGFTHRYRIPAKPRHVVEIHLDALRRLGIQPGLEERRLVLVPGEAAEAAIGQRLGELGLNPHGFIQVHPTSRWLFKCWTVEGYAELINRLQDGGDRVVLTAAPSDTEMQFVAQILARLRQPVVNLAGKLSLKELAALTEQAKLFIGVDSVPMHIAAAMQTPTVTLFGPSGDREWGPWMVKSRVVVSDHSCRPCGMDGCANSKISECLTTLPVETVLGAVRELLA